MFRLRILFLVTAALFMLSGCEGGLAPPMEEVKPVGVIEGTVIYSGQWPPENELRELVFVPLPFVPQQVSDIITNFASLRFSETLQFFVEEDSFLVDEVENGLYVYNIIAQQFGGNIFTDWRPVGVFSENDGLIEVFGDTVRIHIHVDFDNLPPFPPEQP